MTKLYCATKSGVGNLFRTAAHFGGWPWAGGPQVFASIGGHLSVPAPPLTFSLSAEGAEFFYIFLQTKITLKSSFRDKVVEICKYEYFIFYRPPLSEILATLLI